MADDVVAKIEHDHREVEELFAEFEQSGDRIVALQICDELDAHTAAEEAEVYPIVEDIDGEMAEHAEDEHEEAKALIAQIRLVTDPAKLAGLVAELKTAIAHHVEEEENELLPKVRESLSEEELADLGERFDEAKDEASS